MPLALKSGPKSNKSPNLVTLVPKNSSLLHKGKYHCLTDQLFDCLGFNQTCKSLSNTTEAKQLSPNQSNRRSAIQRYFPLRSKWVLSGGVLSAFLQCGLIGRLIFEFTCRVTAVVENMPWFCFPMSTQYKNLTKKEIILFLTLCVKDTVGVHIVL